MLASEFLSAVRAQGKVPADISDASILAFGDREVAGRMVPLLRGVRQEYLVAEASGASYNGRVALPHRSVVGGVRHVQLMVGDQAAHLPRVEPEDDVAVGGANPSGWYVDGGSIVLVPRGSSGTLRMRYFLRPSKLVLESDATYVRSITSAAQASGGWTLTLSGAAPSGSTTFDVVSSGPAHELVAIDLASSTSIPQASCLSVFSRTASPGYVTAPGFTPYVPLPEELAAPCVHFVAGVILRSLGYDQEAQAQLALAEGELELAKTLLAPRSEGNVKRMRGGVLQALSWGWGR
jgi:hypothetical protein